MMKCLKLAFFVVFEKNRFFLDILHAVGFDQSSRARSAAVRGAAGLGDVGQQGGRIDLGLVGVVTLEGLHKIALEAAARVASGSGGGGLQSHGRCP